MKRKKSKKTQNPKKKKTPVQVPKFGSKKLSDFALKNFFRKKTVKSALEKILKDSKANILSVWARDENTNEIEFITSCGGYKKKDIDKERQVMDVLLKKNKPCVVKINENKKIKNLSFVKDNELASSIVIPMKAGKDNIGIILLYNKEHPKNELDRLHYYEIMTIQNEYLKEKMEILLNTANIDSLTKLYNHRSFFETLKKEMSKAHRFKYSVSVLMIDIDHFKDFNDRYGHLVGDKVLYVIAEIIRNTIRTYDIAFRYGGEEITVICPYTTRRQALSAAERIRKNVEKYKFEISGGKTKTVRLTVSIGISSYPEHAISHGELVEKADEALYLAKEEGRNRVCSSLITRKGNLRFAFCPPMLSPFYAAVLRGVKQVAEEVGNVEVAVLAGETESSYEEQMRLLRQAIKDKVDAIGLCSKIDVGDVTVKANKAKIPIFVFNVSHLKMTPKGKVISYICYEQDKAGRKVGQFLARLLRTKGNIAILEGIPNEIDSIERKRGFVEEIKKYPSINIVASQPADWDRKKARKVANGLLKKYPDIDAFFCLSDEMALGAVDETKKAGKMKEIFTIGLDGNQSALQSIKKGELFATLNTNPAGMGKIMMRTVLRSTIKEEVIPQKTESPIMMVDSENVDQYL